MSGERVLKIGSYPDKGIAVLTSGGDAPGMNAALRAVARTCLFMGCKTYSVKEGYQGLVDGYLQEMQWNDVSNIIHHGGTVIGSARSEEFRTREGRFKAAKNLVEHGISNLVVIGGDGSLTGANIFREEWPSLLKDLVHEGVVSSDMVTEKEQLNIVGIVGSIDNDFAGTDMTIGTDSALFRILESIDAIVYTAYSHQRTFIMEVMGRHCGYLALSAGLLSGATAVFIPEEPPVDWEDDLCGALQKERATGQRLSIIIVAEGAIDMDGNPITSQMIKDVVVDRLHHDTRITVLGHVQRGGNPSAFDRILATRMGVEAVLTLLDATPMSEAMVITLRGNRSARLPLMECVRKTQEVTKAMAEKKWDLAVKLRGAAFTRRLEVYKNMHETGTRKSKVNAICFNLAVMHIGAPACGMNATVRAFVRQGLKNNFKIFGIYDGLNGLVQGQFHEMLWDEVAGWVGEGGALLGTQRTLPRGKYKEIAEQLRAHKIHGLYIIGGFEAYLSALELWNERENFPEFCIPIIVSPATISNNVPGSDYSLGSDTALNDIVQICDRMRQSAQGTKRRVFILETMGGYCGYLATLAAIAGGADNAYIYEEMFSIKELHVDLYNMAAKMCAGVQRGLIVRNEKCNDNYNIDFMRRFYSEEGKGIFSARSSVIGHVQQGGNSSPFDRSMGTTLGIGAVNWFSEKLQGVTNSADAAYTRDDETVVVYGLYHKALTFTPVVELAKITDFEKRIPKEQWWMQLRPLLIVMSKHQSTYEEGYSVTLDNPARPGSFWMS